MSEFVFSSCKDFSRESEGLAERCKNDFIKLTASVFSRNISTIRNLCAFPIHLLLETEVTVFCRTQARMEIRQSGLIAKEHMINRRAEKALRALRIYEKRFSEDEREERKWRIGDNNLQGILQQDTSSVVNDGLQSLLATMIISAWAALETLCKDLWIEAVNHYPIPLVTEFSGSDQGAKSLDISYMQKWNFNLASNMGSILVDRNKASFRDFSEAKKIYAKTFGVDWKEITSDQRELRLAEQIRHLFAHRAGLIDEQFLGHVRAFPEFEHAQVGKNVKLKSVDVAKCIDACVKCGVDLVRFVDEWSTRHEAQRKAERN